MAESQESKDGVPLADMIEMLRQELQTSIKRGEGKAVSFNIEKVELELKVVIARKGQARAGVAFWVVTAGAAVESGMDTTHSFKLTLLPVSAATDERLKVAGKGRLSKG